MKRHILQSAVLAVLLVCATAVMTEARVRTHLWLSVPPPWGWGAPYPYYSPYYYPYYHQPQQVIIEKQPDVYIQQEPPSSPEKSFWYYCPSSQSYYPAVKECPAGWMKVVPTMPDDEPQPPK